MKKNYMYQLCWCLIFTFTLFLKMNAQSPGDIAFIAFNADGDDDFAVVVLADLAANSTIYITDNESDGAGGITSGEGTLTWYIGAATIKAGTVIVFTDVNNDTNPNFGVSVGVLSETGAFSIPASDKDGIIAFLGTDDSTPTSFIAAIQIGNDSSNLGPFDVDGITLTNTGLVIGTSIIVMDSSASPDGAIYNASRSSQTSYNNYYSLLIDDDSNWTNVVNGDGETLLPFSSEAFTINTTSWTGASSSLWNLAGNWDNGVPTSSSLATIPDVATSPIISSGAEALVGNLTVNVSESLTIHSNNSITISGLLTVNGSLNLNSSSSLILKGTSFGNITYNRNLGTTNWYMISSPLVGQTIVDFYTNESPYLGSGTGDAQNVAIAQYDNSQVLAANRWSYYTEGQVDGDDGDDTTDTFTSGTGYSVKMQASGDISFTGTMLTDAVGVAITDGTGSGGNTFNLIGNPYPSYIPANLNADGTNNILTINTVSLTENTIWFWNQAISSYDQVNQATGSMFIAPSQGFFVSSNGSNTFNFTEAMQSHQSTDTFQRNVETRPEISLFITDGSLNKQADIFYIDGTTTGFDNGYDSSIFGGVVNDFAIYTHAVANGTGKNLGIQSLPDNNFENMVIPVGLIVTNGTEITIAANAENLPAGINIYLEDKDDNSFTLLDGSSNFTTTLTNDLNGIGRFYLHTTSNPLTSNDLNLENISMYTYSNNNLRIVGIQRGNARVKIYNILGKKVLSASIEGSGLNNVTLPYVRAGVYIIQLETESGTLNKKVIIK